VRLGAVCLVVLAGLFSAGCTNVLGQLDGLPLRVGLDQALVQDAVKKASEVGWKIASGLAVLLGLHCWYRATHGESWISLLKDYLGGLAVCVVLLSSMQSGHGPVEWLLSAGTYLGELFSPGNHAAEAFSKIVTKYATIALNVVSHPADPESSFRFLEAWQFYMSGPLFAFVVAANTTGILIMRLILHVAFVWLSAFYKMVGPLAAPFVILPQTRHLFIGWLRTMASIALWPWLFALAERLAIAIPYSTWVGTDLYTGDLVSGVNTIIQGQIMFFVLNVVFFFVYLGIPVAAHLLVSGAGRPFRGAIR
jgi:hypothetical protein